MRKLILLLVLIFAVSGCSSQPTYKDEQVAAVVRGKEITVRDIRLLNEFDNEELPQVIRNYVREEIMVQEAMKMGVQLSENTLKTISSNHSLPPEPPEGKENPILDFYKNQAKKLGMTPEEYVDIYIKLSIERRAYVSGYLEEKLGSPIPKGEEGKEYHHKLNDLVSNLLNEEEIEIHIK